MSRRFFVTRGRNGELVAVATVDEMRSGLVSGQLSPSMFATESNGESYNEFQARFGAVEQCWLTLAELLGDTAPVVSPSSPSPAPIHWLSGHFSDTPFASLFLGFGILVTALDCLAIPCVVFYQINELDKAKRIEQAGRSGDRRAEQASEGVDFAKGMIVVGGILAFCLNAALFVVFARAMTLPAIAEDQDAENRLLWHAIGELRSRAASQSPPLDSPASALPSSAVEENQALREGSDAPPVAEPADRDLCYLCGKPLSVSERGVRVCLSCRTA